MIIGNRRYTHLLELLSRLVNLLSSRVEMQRVHLGARCGSSNFINGATLCMPRCMLAAARPILVTSNVAECRDIRRFHAQTVADMLKRKRFVKDDLTIQADAPLTEGISRVSGNQAEILLVTEQSGSVVGIVTAHDMLRKLNQNKADMAKALTLSVRSAMTNASDVVHVSPSDSAADAGLIMTELHFTHAPVVDRGEVVGVITLADVAGITYEKQKGGKEAAVSRVLPRKGLREGARIRLPSARKLMVGPASAQASKSGSQLFMRTGAAAAPRARPAHQHDQRSEDSYFVTHVKWPVTDLENEGSDGGGGSASGQSQSSSASAAPSTQVPASPTAASAGNTIAYIGIADGVGSWHEFDVDPRLYATRLMSAAAQVILERAGCKPTASASRANNTGASDSGAGAPAPAGDDGDVSQPSDGGSPGLETATNSDADASTSGDIDASVLGVPPTPMEVLQGAWDRVSAEKVIGSATAAVITVDTTQHQLCVASLGDCGVILLRDTDVTRVGTLLRGGTPGGIRPGWRVSARAMQQLKGFNMPYQLGYAPGHDDKFQKPWEGESLVLPVQPEDLIVVASDGLFDNLDETDIISIVEAWDKEDLDRRRKAQAAGQTSMSDPLHHSASNLAPSSASPQLPAAAAGDGQPCLMDGSGIGPEALALRLVRTAREASLNRMRDGPFARLAKENDILWGGGRPDDITVVVARISRNEPVHVAVAGGSGAYRTLTVAPAFQPLVPQNGVIEALQKLQGTGESGKDDQKAQLV